MPESKKKRRSKMVKDQWLNMRVTEKEKKAVKTAAAKHGRSVSNYLLWLHGKEKGVKQWNAGAK